MSSPYPVLNNKSIDQWRVTELKEELKRRKLPVRGLKEELVRRLAESMDAEVMDIEEKKDDEVKKDEPKVEDQSDSVQFQTENYEVDNASMVNKVKDPDEPDDFSNAAMVDKDADNANIVKAGTCDCHTKVGTAECDAATEATSDVTNKDINKDLKVEDARTVSSGLEVPISETEANLIFLEDGATESHTATLQHDSDAVITRSDEKLDEPVQDNSNLPHEEISPESHNQVSVVSLDLGSQVKCESIPIDSVSIIEKNKLKDNLNADDFHLEKEIVKQEMVQPSSNIVPSLGGDLQTVHDAKEQVKHLVSMEDTNIKKSIFVDDGKKEDNLDEESPEKLNLDRSSSDELMEDDVLESKNIDSNIKTEELVEKTVVIQELIVSDIKNIDVKQDGSIMEEIIDEDIKKPTVLTEKRKLEDQESVAINEVPKRQRRWNSDAVKIPERQVSNLSTSSTPKNTFEITPRRIFMKSDLKSPADCQKERIVPPSQKPATTSLRIDRFLRPFTLKAVQELLAKTGTVCSFWMDHIKTHCYVTYSSVEEATATRNAVYNFQWPPNGGNLLVAEFVDPQEVKARAEAPPQSPASINSNPNTPKAANFQQPQAAQPPVRQHSLKQHQLPLPAQRQPDLQPVREQLPPPPPGEPDPPALTLDDLFKKTKATPRIYYLPLSEEEVASKLPARGKSIKN